MNQNTHPTFYQWRWLALLGIAMILIGFLFNRVVNNLGSVFLAIFVLSQYKSTLKALKQPWVLSLALLGLIPFVSDLVYEGMDFYKFNGDMKLLLIAYPIAIYNLRLSRAEILRFMKFFMVLMAISSFYSLYHFVQNYDEMYETYKRSKVIITLAKEDHIRIAWATVISCVFGFYLFMNETSRKIRSFYLSYVIFQIGFIHVLGSKTGLLSLYIAIFVALIWQVKKVRPMYLATIASVFILLPVILYKTMPTLEQRINFVKYDWEHYYLKNEYKPGLSDAIRFFSIKAGIDIIKENPVLGVGFSRLRQTTSAWYDHNNIPIEPENRFLPSNQWIIYTASGGIIGFLIFGFHLWYPLYSSNYRNHFWFMLFFIPTVCSFMYEAHLETQFALSIYALLYSVFMVWVSISPIDDNVGNSKVTPHT